MSKIITMELAEYEKLQLEIENLKADNLKLSTMLLQSTIKETDTMMQILTNKDILELNNKINLLNKEIETKNNKIIELEKYNKIIDTEYDKTNDEVEELNKQNAALREKIDQLLNQKSFWYWLRKNF